MREEELFGDEREGGMDEGAELGLTRAMRRVEAPLGFAERVLVAAASSDGLGHEAADAGGDTRRSDEQVSGAQSVGPTGFAERRLVLVRRAGSVLATRATGIAAAVQLVLLLPVGGYLHQQARQAQAETAARQFALAMRLTQEALEDAGQHVASHSHALDRER